jgi:hypothetical protein
MLYCIGETAEKWPAIDFTQALSQFPALAVGWFVLAIDYPLKWENRLL